MTNANVLPPSKRPALLWGLVCLVMAAALLILLPQSRLNSSVLAMLPKQAMGDIPPSLNDGFMQRLDRQLVWLVSSGKEANPRVAQEWLTLLQKSAALGDVKGPMDAASQQAWGAFFWQHRNGLIDPDKIGRASRRERVSLTVIDRRTEKESNTHNSLASITTKNRDHTG